MQLFSEQLHIILNGHFAHRQLVDFVAELLYRLLVVGLHLLGIMLLFLDEIQKMSY